MRGVIAAGAPQSAEAGVAMFQQGGNAVDAAVAAAFASFVAEMMVVNIGGGGYGLICDGAEALSYDFFTGAPQRGNPKAYDFHRVDIDFGSATQPFFIGRASCGVPGVVAGLCKMAAEKGRLPLSVLLEPAIALARDGFEVSSQFASVVHLLTSIFGHTPQLRAMMSRGDRFVNAGDQLSFPKLAGTYEALAAEGPDLFYTGRFGQKIVADQARWGGRITAQDMADYRVVCAPPLRVGYRGHEVLLPPPSSLGGVLIAFALKLLETVPVAHLPHNGHRHIRILANIMRLANSARARWDEIPQQPTRADAFLSDPFVAPYIRQLHETLAQGVAVDRVEAERGAGNTSHISAMDNSGMAVSITTTAGENAGFTIDDTGICLNNILGEMDLHPKGFHKQEPGSRVMSMMAPTLVCRDGKPVLSLGSAGSNRIRSAILQSISNMIDFEHGPEKAVNLPRVHHEEGILHLEAGIESRVAGELADDGFNVKAWHSRNLFFGGAQAVACFADGYLEGGGDDRRGGGFKRSEA